jgi:hypothetical protein
MEPVSSRIQDIGLTKPYLAMFSEAWAIEENHNNQIFDSFYNNSTGNKYRYYIEDTKHYDFTDMPAFSPLAPYLGLKGSLDGKQAMQIINAYTVAFFGEHLLGYPQLILDEPPVELPEIIILP